MSIKLNQIILTTQGEGEYIGKPSLLVRVQGCNLNCDFCDSKHSTNLKDYNYSIDNDTEMNNLLILVRNKFINYHPINLILTGGEPFLYANNKFFIKFIDKLINYFSFHTIEIETNGTVSINSLLLDTFKNSNIKINISPKLIDNEITNSNFELLKNSNIKYNIKLLYNDNILKFIQSYNLYDYGDNIYIMPITKDNNIENYVSSSLEVLKFCLIHGYTLSPREQLILYKDKNEFLNFDFMKDII